MTPTLDLTKPVQLRNGWKAEIVRTDLKNGFPVLLVITNVHGKQYPTTRRLDGTGGSTRHLDLINVPEPVVRTERFFSVAYDHGMPNLRDAKALWKHLRLAKVTYENGIPVSIELVKDDAK